MIILDCQMNDNKFNKYYWNNALEFDADDKLKEKIKRKFYLAGGIFNYYSTISKIFLKSPKLSSKIAENQLSISRYSL